ncbi:MAG: hypothetical protein LPK03_13610, partial [Pontibacter sp.]|nr:hypothetical protein [Pontibacter sp.]
SGNATQDLRLMFPEIQKVQVGDMVTTTNPAKPDTVTLVMIDWREQEQPQQTAKSQKKTKEREPLKPKLQAQQVQEYEKRIKGYLSFKLQRDSVQVVSTF